jgi:hypothetical protein
MRRGWLDLFASPYGFNLVKNGFLVIKKISYTEIQRKIIYFHYKKIIK